jgi:hypothetical protein
MKRFIAITFCTAILAGSAAWPAVAHGGTAAGHGAGPGAAGSAANGGGWRSGYGCASGLRKC